MSKSNHANYGKIGFVVIVGVVALFATLVRFGGIRGEKDNFLVETYSRNPVSGLDVGSTVNFRGVKVGTVKKISFIGAEYKDIPAGHGQIIYILLSLEPKLCRFEEDNHPEQFIRELVNRGLHATVTSSGVTGLSHIELNFPKTAIVDEAISWKPVHVCIPPAPSILDSVSDSATKILNELNKMDFSAMWSNMMEIVSSTKGTLDSVRTLLDSQSGNISEILGNVRSASSALDRFAADIKENPSSLLRERTPKPLRETAR